MLGDGPIVCTCFSWSSLCGSSLALWLALDFVRLKMTGASDMTLTCFSCTRHSRHWVRHASKRTFPRYFTETVHQAMPPRPRPRPANRQASGPAPHAASSSKIPTVKTDRDLELDKGDELFIRNRNRTAKDWQRLDRLAKGEPRNAHSVHPLKV